MRFEVHPWDLGIAALYLGLALGHGLTLSRRQETTEDYFLAGRRLGWGPIGLSLYASNMSGASFVGLMGASYVHGLVVFNYEWTAAVVLVLFAWLMLPAFWGHRIHTIPEFLELRLDGRARRAFSGFTVLAILFIDTAGALYAGGIVLTTILPLPLWATVASIALLGGLYTALGGLAAVVATDAVQAVLLMLGAAAILVWGWPEVGGWDGLVASTEPQRLRLVQPAGDDFLPWHGLFGVLLLGFYYWTVNQFVVQRTLGARSLAEGQRGALFAGLLKLPNLALIVLPGVMAASLYPNLANPDLVFPHLAFDLLPAGLRGLVIVALVAAILSSLDSALNAAATLVTMDFLRPLRPSWDQRALVRAGRATTLVAIVISAFYAPSIAGFENLFGYFQSVLAYVTPPTVAVFLLACVWPPLSPTPAFWVLVGGLGLGVPLFIVNELLAPELLGLHYTSVASLLFVGAVGVLVAGSWAAPRQRPVPRTVPWETVRTPGLVSTTLALVLLTAALVGALA